MDDYSGLATGGKYDCASGVHNNKLLERPGDYKDDLPSCAYAGKHKDTTYNPEVMTIDQQLDEKEEVYIPMVQWRGHNEVMPPLGSNGLTREKLQSPSKKICGNGRNKHQQSGQQS